MICWLIANPKPVPSVLRSRLPACSKGRKIVASFSSGIPIPVSLTRKQTRCVRASEFANSASSTRKVTVPSYSSAYTTFIVYLYYEF